MFALAGFGFVCYALCFTAHWWLLSVDFIVRGSTVVCAQPLNNRCATHYAVETKAGAREDFLPYDNEIDWGDYAVGNTIRKERFELSYIVNGARKAWTSAAHLISLALIGFGLLAAWGFMNARLAGYNAPLADRPQRRA